MRKFYRALIAFFLFLQIQVPAQVALSSSPYVQDFNSLSNGADNTPVSTPAPPNGWSFLETGTGANTSYRPHTGSGNSGDTYSFGATTNTERAFGQLRSGSVISTIGASFQNNTGSTLNSITISYVGEQWRLGALSRTTNEKMDFQFSLDATSLSSPNWTDVNELDFTPPITAGTVGALDGNAASNRVTVTFTIVNLNIAHGSTFWIRWNDVDATSSDDGLAIDDFQLTFASGDATPPIFTINYPKTSNLSDSGFDLITNLNEPGKTYFVVLPNNAPAPSSSQVKNGQDGGTPPVSAISFRTIDVANAATDYSTAVSGLASATDYDVYVVAEDLVPNLQTAPVKLDVLTNTAGDITPPTFTATYPNVNTVSATSFTVRTNLDEAGKTYFVVLPAGATAPSSAQVKTGQNGSGVTVALNLAGTINVTSAATEFTSSVGGLSPSTGYDVYIVAEDNVPNLQISPTKISVITSAQYLESFNACDGTASFSQFSTTGAQVWGCTDFGRNATKGIRMNGFSGTAQLNEDWLISPVTTLSANASLTFYSQFSFAGPSLQLKISTNFSGTGDPSSATWTDLNGNFPTVAVPSTSTSLSDWTQSNVDLSAYASQNVYVAFVYTSTTGTNTAARWTLDDISFNNAAASYLEASPSSLSFNAGATVKSYSLRGFNLSNNVTVNAPSNFTVSKDNTTFSGSISYTPAEIASAQNVFVKFDAPAGANTFTGTITNTSTGVSTKNISCRGTDKSQTLDITTYNLEFFGTDVKDTGGAEFGPIDDALQVSNVITVLQNIGADIFAVQEVADDVAFNQLVSNLPGFSGVLANRWSYSFDPPDANFPPQKIGFIYNNSTVQLVSSRVMFTQLYDAVRAGNTGLLPGYPTTASSFWSSGRLPFMATFDVTVAGVTKRVRVVNIHAKSGSATGDYNRRKYDVKVLHDSLVANYANDNIILLGDYNDDVDVSIGAPTNPESTYKVFVDNTTNFNSLTLAISQTGAFSFPSSSSFLDHLTTSNELTNSYISNSIIVEDPRTYISNYVNTTSDHLPVSARFLLSVKADQAITFSALPAKTFGDAAFTLSAFSTSGLPISYASSDATIASISGNTVTILKAGTVSITANQPGDANFNTATSVVQSLTINKANQAITFSALTAKTYGDAAFNLSASSTSGLPITYTSSDATIASISGNTVTILKAGTVNITAIQTGDNSYNAAPSEVQPLVINKANQQIIFAAISEKQFGDAPFALNANTTSGLPITFTALTSNKVTIANNQATIVAGGRVIIVASQTGNANYNAAASVSQTFCIKPAKPTISVSFASGNATLTSSASGGYKWFLNGALIPNANGQSYIATLAGTYKVQVTLDDCLSDFSNDTPVVITGDSRTGNAFISLYPNPTAGSLFISGLEPETNECSIVDLLGRPIMMNLEKSGDQHRLTTESLVDGVYMLRVNQSNSVLQLKFVKKN
ncbi:MAG: choice-of-anchor J domain-containing protein [Cyclobacteriaceae bacterium]